MKCQRKGASDIVARGKGGELNSGSFHCCQAISCCRLKRGYEQVEADNGGIERMKSASARIEEVILNMGEHGQAPGYGIDLLSEHWKYLIAENTSCHGCFPLVETAP